MASVAQRLERGAVGLRDWGARHVRPVAIVALALFVVLCVVAIHEYRQLDLHARWWLIAPAALIGVPLMVLLNAGEYVCAARVAGHRPSYREAVTVSVTGSAANLLPIPGSVLVRNYAMVSAGTSIGGAMAGTIAAGVGWIGITAIVVGACIVPSSAFAAVALVVGGLVFAAAAFVLVRRRLDAGAARAVTATMFAVEFATVVVEIGRYALVLAALGEHPTVTRTLPLVSANVLTAATLVFPAGLGVREALAGVFSTAAHLPAAIGIAASALDRVVVTLMFGLLGGIVAATRRPKATARAAASTLPSERSP